MLQKLNPQKLKASFITVIFTLVIVVASFIVFGILGAITGESQMNHLMLIPFISGYLHGGLEHILWNMIILFLCMLSAVNSNFDYKNIYWIAFFISLIYLPISILGITKPAIGISGVCYFLLTRSLLSWKRKDIGILLLISILVIELSSYTDINNQTAYGVHYIGVCLGFISVRNPSITEKISNHNYILSFFVFSK
jgi:hypothetical protein